jgi:hypothetical protein
LARLASGLNNASFQIGGAVGVAILSTVAVSEADGAVPLAAQTNGSSPPSQRSSSPRSGYW